jgi:hypothetical protein
VRHASPVRFSGRAFLFGVKTHRADHLHIFLSTPEACSPCGAAMNHPGKMRSLFRQIVNGSR